MSARRRARRAAMLAGVLATWWTTPAIASGPPPSGARATPLPAGTESARMLGRDEPIYFEPTSHSARRGAAMRGAYLPVYASVDGPGCTQRWLLIGPEAWVCSERVELSRRAPVPARDAPRLEPSGLPLEYYFVGPDGSFGYDPLGKVDVGVPDAELQPGFAIGILDVVHQQGEAYGLTTKGLWLPMRDLGPARPSSFVGVDLRGGDRALGWTHSADGTHVYDAPRGRRIDAELAPKTLLRYLERVEHQGRIWYRIDAGWVRGEDVRALAPADPPANVAKTERWIDVDLSNQTLIAYVGPDPVYATLVSTGKGRGTDPEATPKGVHRIWVKLRTTDMTNLEDVDASRYYAMEEVPWVMYFNKGYGVHGAYWHDSFGRVRSHGCVNLSPRDAEWLFYWAGPHLPEGWRAVLPTDYDPGTLVRIR